MFRPFEKWRHRNCIDIDIIVQKVTYQGLKYFKVKVLYFNRHYKDIIFSKPDTVKINREDFNNWSLVEY